MGHPETSQVQGVSFRLSKRRQDRTNHLMSHPVARRKWRGWSRGSRKTLARFTAECIVSRKTTIGKKLFTCWSKIDRDLPANDLASLDKTGRITQPNSCCSRGWNIHIRRKTKNFKNEEQWQRQQQQRESENQNKTHFEQAKCGSCKKPQTRRWISFNTSLFWYPCCYGSRQLTSLPSSFNPPLTYYQ